MRAITHRVTFVSCWINCKTVARLAPRIFIRLLITRNNLMSTCIFLVKYELDSEGAYIDGASDLIEFVDVPKELLSKLVDGKDILASSCLKIFEDDSKSASFEINCYLPGDILKIKENLRALFIRNVCEAARNFTDADLNYSAADNIEKIFADFRSLTNLDALLDKKIRYFFDDDSVIVRVDVNE